jgi:hypothetical protein
LISEQMIIITFSRYFKYIGQVILLPNMYLYTREFVQALRILCKKIVMIL